MIKLRTLDVKLTLHYRDGLKVITKAFKHGGAQEGGKRDQSKVEWGELVLPLLAAGGGAVSQGMRAASRTGKDRETSSPPEPPERKEARLRP